MDLEEQVGVEPLKERCESCDALLTEVELAIALDGTSDSFLCARCAAEQIAVGDEPEEL